MIRLMLIDYKYDEPLQQIELNDLTSEGRHQVQYEAEQWIEEIEAFPEDDDE